jgi:uncharacterized protein (DUF488 family)
VELYALGHSTRPQAELLDILRSFGIRTLVDIRTVPRSRTNPQFNPDVLAPALERDGFRYAHLSKLGGLRKRTFAQSPNAGWRNRSFRNYADYMRTPPFEEGLEELRRIAREGPAALMCAEAVPWRCHRSLVADALFARGVVVQQISAPGKARPHRVTPFARFRKTQVSYPSDPRPAPASRTPGRSS